MKKIITLKNLNNEIVKVIKFTDDEQIKLLKAGKIVREREYFGLLAELNNYFTERLLDINIYLNTREVFDEVIFNQLLNNPGNKFILTHGVNTLCENFWDAHHRNRISKFTFTDEYIEQVITIINEEIMAEELSGEKEYIKKMITSLEDINPQNSKVQNITKDEDQMIVFDLNENKVYDLKEDVSSVLK